MVARRLGNWNEFDEDATGNGTLDLEQTRTHNAANEATTIAATQGPDWVDPQHDAAGNMTTMPQPDAPTSSHTARYDAWNRLVSLYDGTQGDRDYSYDGLHRRIVSSEDPTQAAVHYYYNVAWQVLEERQTETGPAKKQFVWGATYIDELVCRDRDADGSSGNGLEERLYALQDALYNVTAVVDAAGVVKERYHYDAYGASATLDDTFALKAAGDGVRLAPPLHLQAARPRNWLADQSLPILSPRTWKMDSERSS